MLPQHNIFFKYCIFSAYYLLIQILGGIILEIYTVKSGDTLYNIAQRYRIPENTIAQYNMLSDPSRLAVGQDLVIPTTDKAYTVSSGESLYSIALQNNVTLDALLAANPYLSPPYTIYPNQIIRIPYSTEEKKVISVNGYAYPNISNSVLTMTLPYLTYLSIFSYRASADGTINEIDDDALIATAKRYSVAPLMVVTNTVSEGGFSSDVASSIFNNEANMNRFIDNIINKALTKGYYGIDIDFEYLYQSDRDNYNSFLSTLSRRTKENNLELSTAVAPKLSDQQIGLLYEAHDYAYHGRTVDFVTIMTYEWGYLYGPPMAVSPYTEVKKVISYAVTEIPPRKVFMGMSNYGYDWTLPYVSGRPARILTVNQAVNLAIDVGAEIQFNESSQAPFFEYNDTSGAKHIVWFENARSIAARLSLVNDFDLGGVSYWNINSFFPQNWIVLDNMFTIRKLNL